jgi:NADH-quinone oxidoreductase subunit J
VIGFWIAAAVALVATLLAVTRRHPVHALLYLVVSLLAVAVLFLLLGAAFAAALEVVIYAGAIMVLFLFVVMLLDLGPEAAESTRGRATPTAWLGPGLLVAILAAELAWIVRSGSSAEGATAVDPAAVGELLFGPWILGVELAGMLLLAGLIGAFHLGRREEAE